MGPVGIGPDDSDEEPVPDEGRIPMPPMAPHTGRPRCKATPGRPPVSSGSSPKAAAPVLQSSTPGVTAFDRPAPTPATQIALEDLQTHEMVGSGTTAEVFRGTWKGKEVAIKQLTPAGPGRGALKLDVAFIRELTIMTRISADIDHENPVKFYGVSLAERPYRIITELCKGGPCFELIHNADDVELTWSQNHKMCCDVARGMEYLHKFTPPIIHRDLKSLNLLLARCITNSSDVPLVKISDFGLARVIETDDCWLKMTLMAGTCHWMAPEVLTGIYDEKVDVYSFAMVLFEIICREVPFEDVPPAQVPRLALNGARPTMEAVPPNCPEELKRLMIECWSPSAHERPNFTIICKRLEALRVMCEDAPELFRPAGH